MEKIKAIDLLKQALSEVPELRKRFPEKKHYALWVDKVRNILELTFGKTSREYENFSRAVSSDYIADTFAEKLNKYNNELTAYETALKSAIHKGELLLEEEQSDRNNQTPETVGIPPKAFIAHGGKSGVLDTKWGRKELMGKKRTIEQLNQLLDEIPDLKQKGEGSREYRLWHDKTRDTLESLFGRDSVEYVRFTAKIRSYNRGASEAEKQERYLRQLEEHETDLISIIQRQGIKRVSGRKTILQWLKSYLIIKPWQRIKSHKIISIVFSIVIFIAAVVAIIEFFLDIF